MWQGKVVKSIYLRRGSQAAGGGASGTEETSGTIFLDGRRFTCPGGC